MPHNSYLEMGDYDQAPLDLDDEFATAHESLRRIHHDPEFIQFRSNKHILSSYDPRYNAALADYAYEYSSEPSPITEAMLATNDFIDTESYLEDNPDRSKVDPAAFEHVAYFGKILHRAFDEYPDLRPSQLYNQLLRAVPQVSPQLRQDASYLLRSKIRGVQHERILKQLLTDKELEHEGMHVTVEDSDVHQDLGGSDYRVTISRPNGDPVVVDVDVKASLSEIEAKHIEEAGRHPEAHRKHRTDMPYWVNPHTGTIMMYSLVTDREMGDSANVPENIARQRSKQAVQLLLLAAQERPQSARAV